MNKNIEGIMLVVFCVFVPISCVSFCCYVSDNGGNSACVGVLTGYAGSPSDGVHMVIIDGVKYNCSFIPYRFSYNKIESLVGQRVIFLAHNSSLWDRWHNRDMVCVDIEAGFVDYYGVLSSITFSDKTCITIDGTMFSVPSVSVVDGNSVESLIGKVVHCHVDYYPTGDFYDSELVRYSFASGEAVLSCVGGVL